MEWAAFSNALAPIQILDGSTKKTLRLSQLKPNNTPVVIGEYKTGANDGDFGDNTGAQSRYGDLTEVK